MRVLSVLAPLLLVALTLAGCADDAGPVSPITFHPDACAVGVCVVDGEVHPDAVDPENGVPVLSFEGVDPSDLARAPGGWAWSAVRTEADGTRQHVVEVYEDGTLRSFAVAAGRIIASDSLLLDDGLWFATAPAGTQTGGEVVHWDLATDTVRTTALPDAAFPFRPVDATDDHALVVSARGATSGQALWLVDDTAQEWPDTGAVMGAMDGVAVYVVRAGASGFSLAMVDRVTASERVLWAEADTAIAGIWSNAGRIAFATTAATDTAVTELHEVDTRTHEIRTFATGRDAVFAAERTYFVQREGDGNPLVSSWDSVTNGTAEGFFLPAGSEAWDVDEDGAWWLARPSTDPRFDEAPNPTVYAKVLYRAG